MGRIVGVGAEKKTADTAALQAEIAELVAENESLEMENADLKNELEALRTPAPEAAEKEKKGGKK